MTIQVAYIFILIVHIESFCHRGKSKLGIGLFIHELLREPLIRPLCQIASTVFIQGVFSQYKTNMRKKDKQEVKYNNSKVT